MIESIQTQIVCHTVTQTHIFTSSELSHLRQKRQVTLLFLSPGLLPASDHVFSWLIWKVEEQDLNSPHTNLGWNEKWPLWTLTGKSPVSILKTIHLKGPCLCVRWCFTICVHLRVITLKGGHITASRYGRGTIKVSGNFFFYPSGSFYFPFIILFGWLEEITLRQTKQRLFP